jgi:hypothetical protein
MKLELLVAAFLRALGKSDSAGSLRETVPLVDVDTVEAIVILFGHRSCMWNHPPLAWDEVVSPGTWMLASGSKLLAHQQGSGLNWIANGVE